jgi:hypothetical protein
MKDIEVENEMELQEKLLEKINEIPISTFSDAFNNWKIKLDYVKDLDGEYV